MRPTQTPLRIALLLAAVAGFWSCGSDATTSSSDALVLDTTTWGVPWNAKISYGAVRDVRDGQVYRTVEIGSQTWMAQNLAYALPGSICATGVPDTCRKYGRLYTWSQAMGLDAAFDSTPWAGSLPRQGLCLAGWHVPTDSEWQVLLKLAGTQNTVQGQRLSAIGAWTQKAGGITDTFGFRLLPAGYANSTTQMERGTSADLVSASELDLENFTGEIDLFNASITPMVLSVRQAKANSYSLRCLRD